MLIFSTQKWCFFFQKVTGCPPKIVEKNQGQPIFFKDIEAELVAPKIRKKNAWVKKISPKQMGRHFQKFSGFFVEVLYLSK